jgi:predicted nucleotidyltransferase
VSQQLKTASDLSDVHPSTLVEAAGPVLRRLAENAGYGRLAVFGSVARGEATGDSDIDLLVEAPEGTSSFEFIRFQRLLERVLGRQIDLVDYGGLKPRLDDDIRRDAVLL